MLEIFYHKICKCKIYIRLSINHWINEYYSYDTIYVEFVKNNRIYNIKIGYDKLG